ncbi:hypothetical protein [Kocuria palustris]|uniref:hypothetical protein n=1 Tax=Kocuria palustris TaxID=71999 RepID=UPI0035DC48A7
MVHLSTAQTAEELNQVLGRTSITTKTVQALIETGLFHDRGTGRSKRIDLQEVQDLVQRVRPVEPSDWPSPFSIFRVSLLGLHSDPVVTHHGTVLRQYAGVDYSGRAPISPRDRELAWTGVWAVAEETAQEAVDGGAILFGTTKGYIDPNYVRQIVGYRRTPDGSRLWWDTVPPPASVQQFVGTGLWMPVQPGRESNWAIKRTERV